MDAKGSLGIARLVVKCNYSEFCMSWLIELKGHSSKQLKNNISLNGVQSCVFIRQTLLA